MCFTTGFVVRGWRWGGGFSWRLKLVFLVVEGKSGLWLEESRGFFQCNVFELSVHHLAGLDGVKSCCGILC